MVGSGYLGFSSALVSERLGWIEMDLYPRSPSWHESLLEPLGPLKSKGTHPALQPGAVRCGRTRPMDLADFL